MINNFDKNRIKTEITKIQQDITEIKTEIEDIKKHYGSQIKKLEELIDKKKKEDPHPPNSLKQAIKYFKEEFQSNENQMKEEIDKKLYGDSTPMATAFSEALRIFEKNKNLHEEDSNKVLLMFSDGVYAPDNECPDEIVKIMKSEPYNFTISTCFLQ